MCCFVFLSVGWIANRISQELLYHFLLDEGWDRRRIDPIYFSFFLRLCFQTFSFLKRHIQAAGINE